jgi:hypothetical protein
LWDALDYNIHGLGDELMNFYFEEYTIYPFLVTLISPKLR